MDMCLTLSSSLVVQGFPGCSPRWGYCCTGCMEIINTFNYLSSLSFKGLVYVCVPELRGSHLLCHKKAENSRRCVEPEVVAWEGVSNMKTSSWLDRIFLIFWWITCSMKVICCLVFLRCLYHPITFSLTRVNMWQEKTHITFGFIQQWKKIK